jgi:hypothetical protein
MRRATSAAAGVMAFCGEIITPTLAKMKWRAAADEDGHYCFAVAL